jgi:hypothetical protein
MEFIHPVKTLSFFEFVDINGQCRTVFPCTCATCGTFKLNGDILVDSPVILDDGAVDVRTLRLLETLDFARWELNTETEDLSAFEVGIGIIEMGDEAMATGDEIA